MSERPPISERQRAILSHITACVAERGYPPTLREIGDHVGLSSTAAVHRQVALLAARGYLAVEPGKQRAIRVIPPTEEQP